MVHDESTDRCDPELRIGRRWAHEQIYSTRQRGAFYPPATTRVISHTGDGHNEIPNSLIKAYRENGNALRDEVRAWRADVGGFHLSQDLIVACQGQFSYADQVDQHDTANDCV